MKKGDIFIIAAVILAVVLSVVFGIGLLGKKGNTVIIKENNEVVYEGSITADKTITLSHNTVVIKKGEVYVRNADCKNQICVNHKPISKKGEVITCLPNKVLAEIR